jgi:hypothetical protein
MTSVEKNGTIEKAKKKKMQMLKKRQRSLKMSGINFCFTIIDKFVSEIKRMLG